MPSEIHMAIEGEGVKPETVSLTDLIFVLRRISTAVSATARDAGVEDIQVSLVSIDHGSDRLTFKTDPSTYKYAARVIEAVIRRDPTKIPPIARQSLGDLWKKADQRSWKFSLQRGAGSGAIASIDPHFPLFDTPTVEGETSLLAYVIRVGGENPPTAQIRVQGAKLTVPVASQEVAEQLGPNLYRHVEVYGKATWRVSDWELTDFRILGVGSYAEKTSDPRGALDELAAASQGTWDEVDPAKFVKELRED